MVSPSSLENLTLEEDESYNLVLSSDFTEDDLAILMTKIGNSSVSEVTLDFSNTSMTQLGENNYTWIGSKVTSVILPSCIQSIDIQEFESAADLMEIILPGGENEYFSVENGILYDKQKTKLVRYPPSKDESEYTLPSTVTTLAYGAFYNDKNLEKINGLEHISSCVDSVVFAQTQKLKEVYLPSSSITSLGSYTFRDSVSLEKVTLSPSVTSMGCDTFNSCSSLKEIHYLGSIPPTLDRANGNAEFADCSPDLKFYVPKGSKSAYLNATGSSGFANSAYNAYATSAEALASIVFEEDPDVPNMLYVEGAYFDGSSAVTDSAVFIADRELIIPDLYVSDHEVTQAEYQAVMGTNPSNFQGDSNPPATGEIQANRPVERISWYDAIMYCNKRSSDENLTRCYAVDGEIDQSQWGYTPNNGSSISGTITCDLNADGYRLPTEAEWEYIARGGNLTNSGQTIYSGSDTLNNVAWSSANGGSTTHEFKKKAANSLGIYDMSGNVWEWCWDWYGNITSSTAAAGASSGSNRILRGGSWYDNDSSCAVSYRGNYDPYVQGDNDGFRVVRSLSYSFHDYVTMLPAGTNGSAGTSGTYALFGDFPQTIKASGVNIDETKTFTMGGQTYYKGSDGNWYVKSLENAYDSSYKYSDDETDVAQSSANSYKYFKVEPIKWRVVTENYNSTGKKLLVAENIMTANIQSLLTTRTIGSDTINANNYKYSAYRAYLNGSYESGDTQTKTYDGTGFLQSAFTTAARNQIADTTVVNNLASTGDSTNPNVCGDTTDKIFLLSYSEAFGLVGSINSTDNSLRIRQPTDYALANHALQNSGKGSWWLRSPGYDFTDRVHSVNGSGSSGSTENLVLGHTQVGVVPALCLNN